MNTSKENTLEISSAVYGLTTKARCVAAQVAETDKANFLVGTNSLREENEIHLVEAAEDENDVKCLSIYSHPVGEIWSISACPADSSMFFTSYQSVSPAFDVQFKSSLWKMSDSDATLKEVLHLKGENKNVLWDPSETTQSESIVSLEEDSFTIWKLQQGSAMEAGTVGNLHKLSVGCWNPHHSEQIATANDNSIRGWDLRTQKETFSLVSAHTPFVRDIDFNPNRDYYLVSSGDDYKIKFWDTRKATRPVKIIQSAHSHWVWCVKYNRYHDQFVLSSSTDSTVSLWNALSVSSMSGAEGDSNSSVKNREDRLIKKYEDLHEDSVYSVAWGMSPWIFASLSYDGRLVINQVPKSYTDLLKY